MGQSAGATGLYAVQTWSEDAIVAAGTAGWRGWLVSADLGLKRSSEEPIEVDEVNRLAVLPSGEVVMMASVEKSTTGFGRTRLIAAAADRAVRWQLTLPSTGRGDPAALVAASDGGLLAVGNGAVADRDPTHVWLARVDTAGKLAWERTLEGATVAWRSRAAAALPDGGFAVAGEAAPSTGRGAPHVWRLAGDGAVRWDRGYGGPDGEQVTGVAATRDGGLVVVGSTANGPGKTNVWILRLDPNGSVVWRRAFGSPAMLEAVPDGEGARGDPRSPLGGAHHGRQLGPRAACERRARRTRSMKEAQGVSRSVRPESVQHR